MHFNSGLVGSMIIYLLLIILCNCCKSSPKLGYIRLGLVSFNNLWAQRLFSQQYSIKVTFSDAFPLLYKYVTISYLQFPTEIHSRIKIVTYI